MIDILEKFRVIKDAITSSITNQSNIYSNQVSSTTNLTAIYTNTSHLLTINSHSTYLFPDRTDDYVNFVAGPTINTFPNWSVVLSNNGSAFTEVNNSKGIHISSFIVEAAGDSTERYILEISHGDSYSVVSRHRFGSSSKEWLASPFQNRVRADLMTANETIWYRMMSSKANATIYGYFRYYHHI